MILEPSGAFADFPAVALCHVFLFGQRCLLELSLCPSSYQNIHPFESLTLESLSGDSGGIALHVQS